jgi:hypothetical protein
MALVAGGVAYGPTHLGPLTVSAVSIAERAYVGHLTEVEFTARPDGGDPIFCSASDAFIWTVPGGFD